MPPKKFSNKKKKNPKKAVHNRQPVRDPNNEQQIGDDEVEESEVDDSGGMDAQHAGVGDGEDAGVGERNGVEAGERNGVEAGERNGVEAGESNGVEAGESNGVEAGERNGLEAGESNGVDAGESNDVDARERNDVDSRERNDVGAGKRNDVDSRERNDVDAGKRNDVDVRDRNDADARDKNDADARDRNHLDALERNDADARDRNDADARDKSDADARDRNHLDARERNDVDVRDRNDAGARDKNDADARDRNDLDARERNDLGTGEEKGPEDSVAKNDDADRVDDAESPDTNSASAAEVAGLAELVEIIKDMGSTTDRETPRVKTHLVDKLKKTPLYPAYEALRSSWQDILSRMSALEAGSGPLPHSPPPTPLDMSITSTSDQHQRPRNASAPPRPLVDNYTQTTPPIPIQPVQVVPPWDGKELKTLEAEITSLSSKIESMSQKMSKMASGEDVTKGLGVVDNKIGQVGSQTIEQVKASAGATKAQVDKVDNTVSKLTTKLDSGVSGLHQGLKQLQDSLNKRPAATVTQNPRPESKPDLRTGELETQVKQLQQALDSTRAELLQADMAFKIALEGDLYDEADPTATSTDSTSGMDSGRDTVRIAQGIRTRTVRLATRCRTLFSLVAGGHGSADANLAIMEGEWGRCVDHLQTRDLIVRKALKEKNEAFRELQCFNFLVDQIRRGFYNRSEWRLALNAAGQNFADLMEPTNDGFSGIEHLAREMYRLQHSPSRPRKASTSSSNPKYGETRSIRSSGWALFDT